MTANNRAHRSHTTKKAERSGDAGGSIVFEGTPDGLAGCKESYTGRYLALREKNE